MKIRKINCGNSNLCSRSSRAISSIFIFLLITTIGYAEKDINQPRINSSSNSQEQNKVSNSRNQSSHKGEICCPEDKYFDAKGTCVAFNETMRFQPPDPFRNVSWSYQRFQCPPGYEAVPMKYESRRLFLKDGSVFLKYREILEKQTKNFCLSLFPTGDYISVSCRPNIQELCASATCVQKCCDIGYVASLDDATCSPSTHRNFSLTFQSVSGIGAREPANLLLLHRIPSCEPMLLLDPEQNIQDHFFLTEDGYLYQPSKHNTYRENRFCLDYFTMGNVTGKQLGAFFCSGPGLPTVPSLRARFYAAGLMISAVALTVTILCNNLISKLRSLQDLNQLCHMISLLVGEISLFIGYVFTNDIHDDHCVVNGIIGQFALLSAFFWLNVICFDIHQYVRATMKLIPRSAIQGGKALRFKYYSLYAWGVPLVITLATGVLHYYPDHPGQTILRPGFGVISCWLYGDIEKLTFFYIWIGALFVGNIFLLAHTAFMMHRTGVILRCTRKRTFSANEAIQGTNTGNIEKFWQSFSLFALMALCWVTEILSWKIPPEALWIPTDIINTLQGFFIFVFFLRIKTKRLILKEFFQSVSERARRISRSEGSGGTIWHCSKSSTIVTEMERNHSEDRRQPEDQRF